MYSYPCSYIYWVHVTEYMMLIVCHTIELMSWKTACSMAMKMWSLKTGGLCWQVQCYWNIGHSSRDIWSFKKLWQSGHHAFSGLKTCFILPKYMKVSTGTIYEKWSFWDFQCASALCSDPVTGSSHLWLRFKGLDLVRPNCNCICM